MDRFRLDAGADEVAAPLPDEKEPTLKESAKVVQSVEQRGFSSRRWPPRLLRRPARDELRTQFFNSNSP